MIHGDDILLRTLGEQEEQITMQAKQIRSMAEEIALLRAGSNADKCVICGAIIPEGRQVCPRCVVNIQEAVRDV